MIGGEDTKGGKADRDGGTEGEVRLHGVSTAHGEVVRGGEEEETEKEEETKCQESLVETTVKVKGNEVNIENPHGLHDMNIGDSRQAKELATGETSNKWGFHIKQGRFNHSLHGTNQKGIGHRS